MTLKFNSKKGINTFTIVLDIFNNVEKYAQDTFNALKEKDYELMKDLVSKALRDVDKINLKELQYLSALDKKNIDQTLVYIDKYLELMSKFLDNIENKE